MLGNTRSNAPKAKERTRATVSMLPVAVSEHLYAERKIEEMRDTTKNTLVWLCQTREIFTASLMASNLLSNTYPFSFPSFNIGLPLWNNALKKMENTSYGICVICHQQPQEKVINYRRGWASDIKNNLFREPRISFAVAAWFSSYYF